VKRPQLIVACAAILLVASLYRFGKTEADMHKHEVKPVSVQTPSQSTFNADSVLTQAKSKLSTEQVVRLNELENSISRVEVNEQRIKIIQQLPNFWADSIC